MKNRTFWIAAVILILIIAIAAFIFWKLEPSENKCTSSGGKVVEGSCCLASGDFPNNCLIGACGCAPNYSHSVKTCDCGEGKCFDGEKCAGA